MLYEDLDDDPVGIASGVLGFLGLDLPAGLDITVRHKRLADELNARWIESYRLHEARERQDKPLGAEQLVRAWADAVADPREGVAADGTIVTGAAGIRAPF